ncbi:MarR family winged helix-turn-helix transcriptional regulator [Cohnella thailandensis]|uniref:MarR family transcriptional regulator n=1 Tax=Cohnella thailandensis TaxID=557557 RepID=A0A841T674_9BACL|nr:MarR family transcriptional regulator [Cohnella thailandensis]MBB6636641.1 MarR family transcriptional regulator [Cohnella thailandensis]MBP1973483.1 DNA-binding MarR family transcriptional regulator [Cohnella thailandensis]
MDSNLIADLFLSFRAVNQSMHHAIMKGSEELGLTPIQFMVLKFVKKTPEIRLSELADCLFIGNSATSGIVDRLVKLDMITRERGERDRRSVMLKMTSKGEELLRKANERREQVLLPLMKLDETEAKQMMETHKKIVNLLEKTDITE